MGQRGSDAQGTPIWPRIVRACEGERTRETTAAPEAAASPPRLPPARELAAGAGPRWPRLKSPARPLIGGCRSRAPRQEFPRQLEAAWDPAAAPSSAVRPSPPPLSLLPRPFPPGLLSSLLTNSGRGSDFQRASVAKPWETRRAPPGNSVRPTGPNCAGPNCAGGRALALDFGQSLRSQHGQRGENEGGAATPREGPAAAAALQWSRDGGGQAVAGGVSRGGGGGGGVCRDYSRARSLLLPDSPPPPSRRAACWGPAGWGFWNWDGAGRGWPRGLGAGQGLLVTLRDVVSCRPKRQPKPSSDEGYWDCSVCTFRNSAEAFKCMMCDVRKGTSTR